MTPEQWRAARELSEMSVYLLGMALGMLLRDRSQKDVKSALDWAEQRRLRVLELRAQLLGEDA